MQEVLFILKSMWDGLVNLLPYAALAIVPSLIVTKKVMKKVYQELELHQDHLKK